MKATLLRYEVEAQVGGKLMQLGSRLIDSVSKKLADEFFASFEKAVARSMIHPAVPDNARQARVDVRKQPAPAAMSCMLTLPPYDYSMYVNY